MHYLKIIAWCVAYAVIAPTLFKAHQKGFREGVKWGFAILVPLMILQMTYRF